MSQPYRYGFSVRVWRAAEMSYVSDDPFSNGGSQPSDHERDWTEAAVKAQYSNIPVAFTSAVDAPTAEAPEATEKKLTAYLPYTVDITTYDRLEIVDGPFAGMYAVDGQPAYWMNPFTGEKPGCVVQLGQKVGG